MQVFLQLELKNTEWAGKKNKIVPHEIYLRQ